MKRRDYLAALTVLSFAGCTASQPTLDTWGAATWGAGQWGGGSE